LCSAKKQATLPEEKNVDLKKPRVSNKQAFVNNIWSKIGYIIFILYFIAACCFGLYFNYQYARTNGFIKWLLFGEVISTYHGIFWPFHLGTYNVTEGRGKHFLDAIENVNRASDIEKSESENGILSGKGADNAYKNYRKALEEAKKVDIAALNRYYPHLGDHFQQEFIRGLDMFLQAIDTSNLLKQLSGQALMDNWGTWYNNHLKEIKNK